MSSTANLDALANKTYNYMPNISAPSSQEVDSMQKNLGASIQQRYQNGSEMPPIRKKRFIAIAVISIGVITGVGCLVAGAYAIPVIRYVAIPCFVASAGGVIYLIIRNRPDLDHPGERSKVQAKIRHMILTDNISLKKLLDKFKVREIIGYQLLDEAKFNPYRGTMPTIDPKKAAEFYAEFEKMANEYNNLESRRFRDLNEMDQAFEKDTKLEFDQWQQKLSAARSKQSNGAFLNSMGSATTYSGVRNKSVGRTVVGVGAQVLGQAQQHQGISEEASATTEYNIRTEIPAGKRAALKGKWCTAVTASWNKINQDFHALIQKH